MKRLGITGPIDLEDGIIEDCRCNEAIRLKHRVEMLEARQLRRDEAEAYSIDKTRLLQREIADHIRNRPDPAHVRARAAELMRCSINDLSKPSERGERRIP
jgi:hypothetical protein